MLFVRKACHCHFPPWSKCPLSLSWCWKLHNHLPGSGLLAPFWAHFRILPQANFSRLYTCSPLLGIFAWENNKKDQAHFIQDKALSHGLAEPLPLAQKFPSKYRRPHKNDQELLYLVCPMISSAYLLTVKEKAKHT